jgi:hypothetical protein
MQSSKYDFIRLGVVNYLSSTAILEALCMVRDWSQSVASSSYGGFQISEKEEVVWRSKPGKNHQRFSVRNPGWEEDVEKNGSEFPYVSPQAREIKEKAESRIRLKKSVCLAAFIFRGGEFHLKTICGD